MKQKGKLEQPPKSAEAEALDSMNARMRRKFNVRRLMEASIEAKAKRIRSEQAPASAGWKRS